MCLSCICLLAMHTLICVIFSLPGVRGWLPLLPVALPGLCLPFFIVTIPSKINVVISTAASGRFVSIFIARIILIKAETSLRAFDKISY